MLTDILDVIQLVTTTVYVRLNIKLIIQFFHVVSFGSAFGSGFGSAYVSVLMMVELGMGATTWRAHHHGNQCCHRHDTTEGERCGCHGDGGCQH